MALSAGDERPGSGPLAYLITFACYGAKLHGCEKGSVDSRHNLPGSRYLELDTRRERIEARYMRQPPYQLDTTRRVLVLQAIREVCLHRSWSLQAAHVRTNHVHVVVTADPRPEKVMTDFKAYASRRLNREGLDHLRRLRWSRHGSTRYLWAPKQVEAAIRYVLDGQGNPMATYPAI